MHTTLFWSSLTGDVNSFLHPQTCFYVLCICEVIGVCYIYGLRRWTADVEFMLSRRTSIYWRFCWCAIPALLVSVLAYKISLAQDVVGARVSPQRPRQALLLCLTLVWVLLECP